MNNILPPGYQKKKNPQFTHQKNILQTYLYDDKARKNCGTDGLKYTGHVMKKAGSRFISNAHSPRFLL